MTESKNNFSQTTEKEIILLNSKIEKVRKHIGTLIFGQQEIIDLTLISLLTKGHVLLVGLPGLAKTRLAKCLGSIMGLTCKRIQFTPDLMPSDIIGTEVMEESDTGKRSFRFVKGPVFCQLLLADEINRASPRTQSALLQAMQEQQVTVAGKDYDVPRPFHVLATQNPIEQEGTYSLPEAQLDRFLMQINIEYTNFESEKKMLIETTGNEEIDTLSIMTSDELLKAQEIIRDIPIGNEVVETILTLVREGRPNLTKSEYIKKNVVWGPGPRASQALILGCKAKAIVEGRLSPSIDDVLDLSKPILRHRMALSFNARTEGKTIDDIISFLTEKYR